MATRPAWWNEMDGLLSAEATVTRITVLVWHVSFRRAGPVPTRGRVRIAELQTRAVGYLCPGQKLPTRRWEVAIQ